MKRPRHHLYAVHSVLSFFTAGKGVCDRCLNPAPSYTLLIRYAREPFVDVRTPRAGAALLEDELCDVMAQQMARNARPVSRQYLCMRCALTLMGKWQEGALVAPGDTSQDLPPHAAFVLSLRPGSVKMEHLTCHLRGKRPRPEDILPHVIEVYQAVAA